MNIKKFKKIKTSLMNVLTPATITAALIIAAGVLGLIYGSFDIYTTHEAQWRGVDMSFRDTATVYIPKWVSAGAIVYGVLLMLATRKS